LFTLPGCIFALINGTSMRYSKWIGIGAALIMVAACFIPWTYYPDLGKTFNGFFSQENAYGKPGILLTSLAVICTIFFLINRVWSKYWNIFFTAICFTYAIKSFLLFAGCYPKGCPEKLTGIWLMLASAALMFLSALLPEGKRKNKDLA
jgi:hypothetical protein